MQRAVLVAVGLLLTGRCWCAIAAEPNTAAFKTAQIEFFEKSVRPLLSAKCFSCHGPKKQEAGLRLDSRASLLKGSDRGAVVQPLSAQRSLLIEAIGYEGDVAMPPEAKLSEIEIATLTRWVAMGLPWPDEAANQGAQIDWKTHWAFQPPRAPPLPEVKNIAWPRTSIDRFVLARLEVAELTPSPAASRRTLIRRATFDLTGLPPTPAQIEAYLSDDSPRAYARVIDRLLASPRYGERWGRHWLDVARYADNKGYILFEEKKFPWAYTYRDYVIEALNADLPYDRFVLEQLAADQLDLGEDRRPLRAMGFLTVGGHFLNNTHDIIDDRIDVVARGLLGLTVTCARCHQHKYDPIPQEDYYSLYGVLRSCREPILPPLYACEPPTAQYRAFAAEMDKRQGKLDEFVDKKFGALVADARSRLVEYLMAAHALRGRPSTEEFMLLSDAGQLNPSMIRRWRTYLDNADQQGDGVWGAFNTLAELPPRQFADRAADVLRDLERQRDSQQAGNPLVLAALRSPPPRSMRQVAVRYEKILADVDARWQAELKRNPASSALRENVPNGAEQQLRQAFYAAGAPLNIPKEFGRGVLNLFPDRTSQAEFKKLLKEVETWSMTGEGAPPRAMVLLDAAEPYQPRVFLRGNPNRPGREVPRQFLGVLSRNRQPFRHGSGRLELAQAIVDPENPLTARVIVNRVWLHHFGRGLVGTPSDFGTRSDPPTHPELLDHLAVEFMADGWSLKNLHRRIMLSAVYRQASEDRADCQRVDPVNRLLWKMNRRRLEFEATRDALLAVSNHLETQIGGPPVDVLSGDSPRRSVYGFIDRMDVPGLLTTFDFPNPAASSPQRESTTVPTQALYFMNGRLLSDSAARLSARRDIASTGQARRWVEGVYAILFARRPSESELELAQAYLTTTPTPRRLEKYVHALLMTNEFVFID